MLCSNNLLGDLHDSLHLTKAESNNCFIIHSKIAPVKKKKKIHKKNNIKKKQAKTCFHLHLPFTQQIHDIIKARVVLHLQIADVIGQVVFLLFFLCFQAVVEVFLLHKTREIFGLIFVLLTKTTQLCP